MIISTGSYKVVDDTGKMKFVFEAKYDREGCDGKDIIYAKSLLKLRGLTLHKATPEELENLKDEIGDVRIYLEYIAERYNIDTTEAMIQKIPKNAIKYPVNP